MKTHTPTEIAANLKARQDVAASARDANATSIRHSQDRGRRQILELAAAGNADALDHFRRIDAKCPLSTSNSGRDHRLPPASDAEIQAWAVRELAARHGGRQPAPSHAPAAAADLDLAAIYSPRASGAQPARYTNDAFMASWTRGCSKGRA
jgi:hypothetical protein